METFIILMLMLAGLSFFAYHTGLYARVRDTISRLWIM